jgi:hypothetical protein
LPSCRTSETKDSSGKARFSILSRVVEVRSDSSRVLGVLRFQYRHFLATSGASAPARRVELLLEGPQASLKIDGISQQLPGLAVDASQGLSLLLEAILDSVTGHLLFHAGVVSRGDVGMLVTGPPGFGKTSLVLELARRGFGFLSDDYAPISEEEGLVLPFPRSLGLVASSRQARLLLRGLPSSERFLFGAKWLVDPATVPGLRLAGPCRPAVVLLLGPGAPPGSRGIPHQISVARERVTELRRLFPEIRFRERRDRRRSGVRTLRFELQQGKGTSGRLEEWAYSNRPSVFLLTRTFSRRGAFRPPLRILRVAPREGLLEILGDLQNRRPLGAGRAGQSPSRLLLAAASALGRSEFYRLEGGSLSSRAVAAARLLDTAEAKLRGTG